MAERFGLGWRQVAICFMLLAAVGMIASTYSLVAVPLAKEFQPSRAVLMLTMTVYSGACAIMAPFIGTLMDRVSLRRLMIVGGVLLGTGYAAISFATSFNQVLIIFGILIAPANLLLGPVAATVLLTRWFSQRRGRAMGIAIAGIAAGGFVFPMIIQGLLDTHQWREAIRLLGLILAVWTIPLTFLVIDRPSDRGLHPDGERSPAPLAHDELSAAPISTKDVLMDPAFWMICVTVAVVTSGMKGMITNLAQFASDAGVTATDAATLISVYAGCGFIAKMAFAALADRVGPRILMAASLGGFSIGMALLTNASAGYAAIAFGVSMIGLFGGMMVPIESFLAPRVFGKRIVGKAMGLLSGSILVFLLVTPPLFGLISDLTGSYKAIFWTFAGLAVVALLGVRYIRLTPRDPEDAAPVAVPAE